MIVTVLSGVRCTPDRGQTVEGSKNEILDSIIEESAECASSADKSAGEGFVLAQYKPGAVSKHVQHLAADSATEIFCYDIDSMSIAEVEEAFPIWQEHNCSIYSTYSHSPETPKYRLMVGLSKPVRNKKSEYLPRFLAVAKLLKIKVDPSTKDVARFFLGPQHKPGITPERMRFRGRDVPVETLRLEPLINVNNDIMTVGAKPGLRELKATVRAWRSQGRAMANVLEAVLRGENFAESGSRHAASTRLAFDLVREYGRLDADWFGAEYLKKIWDTWGQPWERDWALEWRQEVDSAWTKHQETAVAAETAKAAVVAVTDINELTEEEKTAVAALGGRLICSHRQGLYVYNPKQTKYQGPYAASELPAKIRDLLGAVAGVEELRYTKNRAVLKTAIELLHEYGQVIDEVRYWGGPPPVVFDEKANAINIQAYNCNDFKPRYHQITDDLIKTIAGDGYKALEAYFYKFTDLDQPLPALTLVGPRGCWKSRICSTLPRFWGDPEVSNGCKAQKVMGRFNGELLHNPVIISDEKLATSEMGKRLDEKYRESVTEKVQVIEQKKMQPVVLRAAIRHCVAVNDVSKVFSYEVDAACVEATMERFLIYEIDGDKVQAFEDKWAGTEELEKLRDGIYLLEHIAWIRSNKKYWSKGRLFVETLASKEALLSARFCDDELYYCWALITESVTMAEQSKTAGKPAIFYDPFGQLRLNPTRVVEQWNVSQITSRAAHRAPSGQKIGILLSKAGFKKYPKERASKSSYGGWVVDMETLEAYYEATDIGDLAKLLSKVTSISA